MWVGEALEEVLGSVVGNMGPKEGLGAAAGPGGGQSRAWGGRAWGCRGLVWSSGPPAGFGSCLSSVRSGTVAGDEA